MKPFAPVYALPALALLVACATPQEQCISQAYSTYNATLEQLAETEGNIARGYAIHQQEVPYEATTTCYDHKDRAYSCTETRFRTKETPVSIDISEERRKRGDLQAALPAMQQTAESRAAQCRVQYPAE